MEAYYSTLMGTHAQFDESSNEDESYGIPVDFDQKVADLHNDDLYNFFLKFDFDQLDYIANNRDYDLSIMHKLWKAILKILEDDIDTAQNNMENCIEDNIYAGISAWGGEFDYLFKKQKEYQELLSHLE